MPYCARTLSESAAAGLLNSRSVPAPVLGKAITSLMDSALQRIAMRRSKPDTWDVGTQSTSEARCEETRRTQRDASVRWSPTTEGVQQVAERLLLVLAQLCKAR